MIRVRYATGLVVQYNDATTIQENGSYVRLFYKDGNAERLVAVVQNSAGVIFEWVYPCSIKPPQSDDRQKVEQLQRQVDRLKAANRKLKTPARKGS